MIHVIGTYVGTTRDRFDLAYYKSAHVKVARELLTPHGLLGLRVLSGFEPLADDTPGMIVVSEMTFSSKEGFEAGIAAVGEALFADLANFTSLTPMLQICSEAIEL